MLWRLLHLLPLLRLISNMLKLLLLAILLLLSVVPRPVLVPDHQQQVLHTAAASSFTRQLMGIQGGHSCPHRRCCTAATAAAAQTATSDVQRPACDGKTWCNMVSTAATGSNFVVCVKLGSSIHAMNT
jgi:hypothetical protein